jgi:hypothetical protein
MSDWFFWNLTNIIFHEGLYRQSREKKFRNNQVKAGLENRLENFASNLMNSFYQLTNARVQDLIARLIVVLTIAGVIVAIVEPFLLHFLTPPVSSSTSSAINQTLARFSLFLNP